MCVLTDFVFLFCLLQSCAYGNAIDAVIDWLPFVQAAQIRLASREPRTGPQVRDCPLKGTVSREFFGSIFSTKQLLLAPIRGSLGQGVSFKFELIHEKLLMGPGGKLFADKTRDCKS